MYQTIKNSCIFKY